MDSECYDYWKISSSLDLKLQSRRHARFIQHPPFTRDLDLFTNKTLTTLNASWLLFGNTAGNQAVKFLDFDSLIQSKVAAGQPQDLADMGHLVRSLENFEPPAFPDPAGPEAGAPRQLGSGRHGRPADMPHGQPPSRAR